MSKQKELVQYFVVNTDLGMSAGKIAAQVGHASMIIALRDQHQENFQVWKEVAMKKIVLGAAEERMLQLINENPTAVRIIDKGFTEIAPNSLTVIGLPVMTRREAYKWVHGLSVLKLDDEKMTFNQEQKYIKEMSKDKRGIFYLPRLNAYSASILVDNPTNISVLEDGDTESREEPYIEHGAISDIISDIMFILDKQSVGTNYSYKIHGVSVHTHTLECVYKDAVNHYEIFEFEEPIHDYFSNNEKEIIEAIIKYQKYFK